MARKEASLEIAALILAFVCVEAASGTRGGDYSAARMPQYGDYEKPHDAPAALEEYRENPPDAPTSLDYKYDDEVPDKTAEDPKINSEIDDWRKPMAISPENDNKVAHNDYLEESDRRDEDTTKFRSKYPQSKNKPRAKNRKVQRQSEASYHKADERGDDDVMMDSHEDDFEAVKLPKVRNFNNKDNYVDKPRLNVKNNKNNKNRFSHSKTTEKVIRRKVRDRIDKDSSDVDNPKSLFDVNDIFKLKPGNLLADGALVPKPIKFNTDSDYSDIKRLQSKDRMNLPLRKSGERDSSDNSEDSDASNLLKQRRTDGDFDAAGDALNFDLDKIRKPFQGKFDEKKVDDEDYVRNYLTSRIKEQNEMKANLNKEGNYLPSEDMSDIDSIKKHLTPETGKKKAKIEDYKTQDSEYDEKESGNDDNLPKSIFPSDDRPFIVPTKDYNDDDMATRTLPPYRRMDSEDSNNIINTLHKNKQTTLKTPTKTTLNLQRLFNLTRSTTKKTITLTTEETTTSMEPVINASTDVSLAEKSRLSIMKKVMRKENVNSKITKKPPVLMQVTQGMNTMVMVEPPSTFDPWIRAKEVSGDSENRLKQVKRLMRHKLVSNAKNIRDLTENWDDMICDYLDMSLVENYNISSLNKANLYIVLLCISPCALLFTLPMF